MTTDLMASAEQQDYEAVLASFRSQPRPDVADVADHLREADIYNVAIELYRWLLDQEKSARAHFGLGQCLGKIYDYDTALEHLDQAFRLEPDMSAGASYYAYILERKGRMEEAAHWYGQALQGAEADDLWARSHYAWFLEKCGRLDEAHAAYADVLERNQAYTWAVKRWALLLHRLGRRGDAEALVQGAVDRNPQNLFARLNLLEYRLLDEDDAGYGVVRASIEPGAGPPWFPVVVDLFDLVREQLLPRRVDPEAVARWEAAAAGLKDSVHRDFDDLTALLERRGGEAETWRRLVQTLLK